MLLEDCDSPVLEGDTEVDLFQLALRQKEALNKCTEQKRALR